MENIRPFVKWAGGKRDLIPQLRNFYPFELENNEINRYVEPFVGGGAILINILQKYNVHEAYVFDINADLINCYNVIKNNVEQLIDELKTKQDEFLKLNTEERSAYFYDVRKEYNSYTIRENEVNIKRASEFIFLNRTCFNGLYRMNKKGEFNVPCGKYKNPTICDEDNLRGLSDLIKDVQFQCGDYKESGKYIDNNTFVYFDPPYRPLSTTSGFTSYSKEDFNDENQKQLAQYFRELNEKGAKLMLSNSNPKNTNENDDFFEKLYNGFNINEIYAKRMINANAKDRGEISELLITNYKETEECIQENSIFQKTALN